MGIKALVIVPTYNEQLNIRALVDAVLAQDARLEMLVVDDNSPDGTGKTVEEIGRTNPRVHLLSRPGKLGLGTAYRDGFRWALQRPEFELIFEMDADFSHDPAHLPLFLLAAEKADFVLGCRYLDGNVTVVNWPIRRLMLVLVFVFVHHGCACNPLSYGFCAGLLGCNDGIPIRSRNGSASAGMTSVVFSFVDATNASQSLRKIANWGSSSSIL